MAEAQTPLERAARAIIAADAEAVENEVEPTSPEWAGIIARAVLMAIREPSEAMVAEGQMVIDGAKWEDEREQSQIAWQAMIDAALAE